MNQATQRAQIFDLVRAQAKAGESFNNAIGAVCDAGLDANDIFEDHAFRDEIEKVFTETAAAELCARATVRYTTAPASYDGFGTTGEDAGTDVYSGTKTWRRIFVQPQHLQWQLQRNGSGNHATLDETEFARHVELNLIKAK